ncbi:DUF4214 domain-containing protein [Chelatococcus asaccharovorans]|uniref:Uncharacterized protein DUF4214 n=1 Tax=Chelatococcus asaccharovorans TaxID=28210 RepID=A0A2V3U8L1_9HYPH|nr:DUF4214 domain-containing protein [Chelatococcus asaccharovorans]MBS7705571.1 DUF4214 domain-containing protein [Chelatococcus asaccharovorans]PXW60019.1 uncharacterized protein DUF4214 [Chelatococcus asaccharovorans]
MPAQQFTAQMYNAFLGRAPEPNGYAWWVSLYPGMTETAFINAWAATAEAKALNPWIDSPTLTNAHIFIASLYVHLYDRIPDAAGQTYWANELQASGIAPVLLTLLGVGGTDGAVLANRTEVGVYFAEKFLAAGAAPAFSWQQSILNSVDATSASVTAAKAQIDAWVAAAPLDTTLGTYAQVLARAKTYNITGLPSFMTYELASEMLAAANPTGNVVGFVHNGAKLGLVPLYLTATAIAELGPASAQTVASVFADGPIARVTLDGQPVICVSVNGDLTFSVTTDFVLTGLGAATITDFVLA